jgi:DNA-binding transcriptional MerR regulator
MTDPSHPPTRLPHSDESRGRDATPERTYRIATVAERTGVPETTLRAWERRYGIPTPERTASGYRLYGETEVRQVVEMRRLCEEGVAAAEAARVVLSTIAGAKVGESAVVHAWDAHAKTVEALLDAISRLDDVAMDDHLRRLMFLGSAGDILDRVLEPCLHTVGDLWHAGELSVAQEHFASQTMGNVLRDLIRLCSSRDATERVVLASFADEEHEIGLLGTALRFAEWHMRPLFLGARTPPSAIRTAVEAWSPRLVALSVTVTPPRPRARELLEDYAAACEGVAWIVGGPGAKSVADLVERCGGAVAPGSPDELRAVVRALVSPASAKSARKRLPR